jgi:hypothetical protein
MGTTATTAEIESVRAMSVSNASSNGFRKKGTKQP